MATFLGLAVAEGDRMRLQETDPLVMSLSNASTNLENASEHLRYVPAGIDYGRAYPEKFAEPNRAVVEIRSAALAMELPVCSKIKRDKQFSGYLFRQKICCRRSAAYT